MEYLPLPSLSLLKKVSQGGIASMKSLELLLLLGKGNIDVDVIPIIDEMYLQRSCEYSRDVFVGRDENGQF